MTSFLKFHGIFSLGDGLNCLGWCRNAEFGHTTGTQGVRTRVKWGFEGDAPEWKSAAF